MADLSLSSTSLVIIPIVMLEPCPFEEPHFAPARPPDMTRQRPAGIALPSHQCRLATGSSFNDRPRVGTLGCNLSTRLTSLQHTSIAPSDRAIRTARSGSCLTSLLGTCGNFRLERGVPRTRSPIRGPLPFFPPVCRRPQAKVQVEIRFPISVQPPDSETVPNGGPTAGM